MHSTSEFNKFVRHEHMRSDYVPSPVRHDNMKRDGQLTFSDEEVCLHAKKLRFLTFIQDIEPH